MKFSHDSEGFTHLGASPTMQMKEHCNVVMIIFHKSKWTIVSRLVRLRKGVSTFCLDQSTLNSTNSTYIHKYILITTEEL